MLTPRCAPAVLLATLLAHIPLHVHADDWLAPKPSTSNPSSAPASKNPPAKPPQDTSGFSGTGPGTSQPVPANTPDPSGTAILASVKQRDQYFKIAPNYCRAFIRWGDDYAVLPAYNPTFPNNVGYTVDQAQVALGKPGTAIDGAVVKKVTFVFPKAETQALVMPIREIVPGQYGFIHSFKIDKILGSDEMMVSDIWIIDLDVMSKEMDGLWIVMERKARGAGETNARLKAAVKERNDAILSTIIVNPDGTIAQPQIDKAYTDSINALPTTEDLLRAARKELDDMYTFRVRLAKAQQSGRFKGPFKVKGYLTAGIIEGTRWHGSNAIGVVGQGFQIAVIRPYGIKPMPAPTTDTAPATPTLPPPDPLVIIPAASFKNGLTPEQFAVMLAKYGVTPDQFVDMAVSTMRADSRNARQNIFMNLENLRRNWEAAINAPTPPSQSNTAPR
jgi:hypothetical protein